VYDELRRLTSSTPSYKNLRVTLYESNPPIIPYLGFFLSDLTFINDGNREYYYDDVGKSYINWHKKEMISHVIDNYQIYQSMPYTFLYREEVYKFLLWDIYSEEWPLSDLVDISYLVEPRKILSDDQRFVIKKKS